LKLFFERPVGITDALLALAKKALLPTTMDTQGLRTLSRDVRAASLFSARTAHLGYLETIKAKVDDMLSGKINIATGRAELQDALDAIEYQPDKPGDITDLSSDARLRLILETQTSHASNWAMRKQGMDEASRFQFPAWELVRISHRVLPRNEDPKGTSWFERWQSVGGQLQDGRMIALKDSPIWSNLGDSGLFQDGIDSEVPPYAFNSGMGWREVSREEAKSVGLIKGDEMPAGTDVRFFDESEFGTKNISTEDLSSILEGLRAA
jgi:hypothetical protein